MSAHHRATRSHRKVVVSLVVIAALAVGGVAFWQYEKASNRTSATKAADRLATAWQQNSLTPLSFSNTSAADADKQFHALTGNLTPTSAHVTADTAKVNGKSATTTLNVTWPFGKETWTYKTTLSLHKNGSRWLPEWNPSVVEPSLETNDHLQLNRVIAKRGDILGNGGQTLVTDLPVVYVGVQPNRTTDVDGLSKSLGDLLKVDAATLAKNIKASKPDAFVDVITLRQTDYDAIKTKLQPLPGAVFRQSTLPLAPSRQFAAALLGRSGPVTADIVKNSNGKYVAGDIAGLSGLQLQYDGQLSGTAGVEITNVSSDISTAPTSLFKVQPIAGQSIQLSLDSEMQLAADNAIAGQTKPTSFVAIRASTGEVLAVSNGPDVTDNNRAFVGQYPPGSSFKVLTTYALLGKGVKATDNVACPPTITVDGRSFKNAEDEAFASAPFSTDFAKSCNTAFVSLAPKVPGSTLHDTASLFGIGAQWNSGVNTYSGNVPTPGSAVDLAATSFGQGRNLMSPLAMANVAAGVASGMSHAPVVVVDPAQTQPADGALDPTLLEQLRPLMRQVVTSGTGTAVAGVPGGDVFGKTGTAEFGNANPPQSHAWFVGYQNDIAFAAFVEGGEFGGDTAAPIAAKFLRAIN